jgi:hypothetical protein
MSIPAGAREGGHRTQFPGRGGWPHLSLVGGSPGSSSASAARTGLATRPGVTQWPGPRQALSDQRGHRDHLQFLPARRAARWIHRRGLSRLR